MMAKNDDYGRKMVESDDVNMNISENKFSRSLELKNITSTNFRKNKYSNNNDIKDIESQNCSDITSTSNRRNLFSREMKEEKEKNIFRKTMQKFKNASTNGDEIYKNNKIINLESFNTLYNCDNKKLKNISEKDIIKNQIIKSNNYSVEIAEKIDIIYQKNKLDLLSTRRVLSLASLTAIKPDNVIEISPKKEKLLQIEKQIQKQFSISNSNNRKKDFSSNQILLFDNGVLDFYANKSGIIGSTDDGMYCTCTVCTVRTVYVLYVLCMYYIVHAMTVQQPEKIRIEGL